MSNSGQERSFRRGKQCLEEGDSLGALAFFEAAIRQAMKAGETPRPRDLSYYGLCLALGTRHLSEAKKTCRRAMELEFYNPDLYLNLGTVYMLDGDRAAAFDAFLSGLRLQSDHPGIVITRHSAMTLPRNPISRSTRPSSHSGVASGY